MYNLCMIFWLILCWLILCWLILRQQYTVYMAVGDGIRKKKLADTDTIADFSGGRLSARLGAVDTQFPQASKL